jgi:hypothetical protein
VGQWGYYSSGNTCAGVTAEQMANVVSEGFSYLSIACVQKMTPEAWSQVGGVMMMMMMMMMVVVMVIILTTMIMVTVKMMMMVSSLVCFR